MTDGNSQRLTDLMRSSQDGDGKAYLELLRAITPMLRATARRQLPVYNRQDMEDVVQDILMSLHAARATYDPERPFIPWLMGIARNRIADAVRRYARQAAHEQVVEIVPETFFDPGANMSAEVYRDPEALRRAIDGLPHQQRRAMELLKLREMSLKEAAAVSGTSVGALKIAVHRAVGTLREVLSKGT
ncbi:DNA-directed RNA polymerase sigma-70 factor [Mesorhizobium tianshanense]|uniref:RNA polymerase, sigma subunit, ECF family n=1 Tax=Mesorhizobium tianshanense TaxID=39844 RepID=A0A562P2M7_9HYPH|nr:sigma-70 family RNA polymerase sigma factor [Mesorhizobium tianshanense]TWI38722.1 RNA polymerase, sigma subunit, ECF family [Mesorhizobium tianshanense]GLS36656.1 DNA-directed RNA polymerase sigma-70 factor [Mesorhizobium tianshanense]